MNMLFPLIVRTQLSLQTGRDATVRFIEDRVERLRDPDERGADIFEWAGMLILVAAIIAALYGLGIVNTVSSKVKEAVDKIFNGNPSGGGTPNTGTPNGAH
ncbi:Flp family type IVb pilin [Actinomadura roseirufa]|uniref:Flp family type IVb pilin n=1 Tax=Actinomadura roseirufa TaxID=2094049 RepID=UPI001041AA34|nr:hypothetical protein [Actinomadura roseirufa]